MGKMLVQLMNVHIAGTPTFFPAADPLNHHCMMTVINNRGKNQANEELRDEVTLNFWGKYAQTAALYLDKGREINVVGELRSFTENTGQTRPDGKAIIHRKNEIRVDTFFFGSDTKAELVGRINANLAKAKAAGKLNPDATLTGEDLIEISRGAAYDYNPQLALQTGMYGNARVYDKALGGFITPNAMTGAAAATGTIPPATAEIEALKKQIAEMTAGLAAVGVVTVKAKEVKAEVVPNDKNAAAGTATVDPFIGT